MKGALRILILEDRASNAELMEWELKKAGISFISLRGETRPSFEAALTDFHPDLILSDYSLPDYNGRDALEFPTKYFPDIPVIMVTGTIGAEAAVELLKAGAKGISRCSAPKEGGRNRFRFYSTEEASETGAVASG